jgi:hypothetical protein
MSRYKVTRHTIVKTENDPCRHNWPLRVTVEAIAADADPNVFVYHIGEDVNGTGIRQGDTFSNVASKQDMDVIPVGEPIVLEDAIQSKDRAIPYYRTNTVELDCYNVDEAERVWRIIQHDITSLVREYVAWDNLDNGQQETILI